MESHKLGEPMYDWTIYGPVRVKQSFTNLEGRWQHQEYQKQLAIAGRKKSEKVDRTCEKLEIAGRDADDHYIMQRISSLARESKAEYNPQAWQTLGGLNSGSSGPFSADNTMLYNDQTCHDILGLRAYPEIERVKSKWMEIRDKYRDRVDHRRPADYWYNHGQYAREQKLEDAYYQFKESAYSRLSNKSNSEQYYKDIVLEYYLLVGHNRSSYKPAVLMYDALKTKNFSAARAIFDQNLGNLFEVQQLFAIFVFCYENGQKQFASDIVLPYLTQHQDFSFVILKNTVRKGRYSKFDYEYDELFLYGFKNKLQHDYLHDCARYNDSLYLDEILKRIDVSPDFWDTLTKSPLKTAIEHQSFSVIRLFLGKYHLQMRPEHVYNAVIGLAPDNRNYLFEYARYFRIASPSALKKCISAYIKHASSIAEVMQLVKKLEAELQKRDSIFSCLNKPADQQYGISWHGQYLRTEWIALMNEAKEKIRHMIRDKNSGSENFCYDHEVYGFLNTPTSMIQTLYPRISYAREYKDHCDDAAASAMRDLMAVWR